MSERFELTGTVPPEYPTTAQDYYHQAHNEAMNWAATGFRSRFDQPGYRVCRHLEELRLKSAFQVNCEVEMLAVTHFYKDHFKPGDLMSQPTTMGSDLSRARKREGTTVSGIVQYVRVLSACQKSLLLQVVRLVKLLLVR